MASDENVTIHPRSSAVPVSGTAAFLTASSLAAHKTSLPATVAPDPPLLPSASSCPPQVSSSGAASGASSTSVPNGPSTTTGSDGSAIKKRKTGPGSRGVANLTPEQLAKKRANDREAQRAIRERTKAQIEGLEGRIRELTSQQPYQELQAALKEKADVENQLNDMKKRLQSVVAMIQPLIGGPPEPVYAPPGPSSIHPVGTPNSTAVSSPAAHGPPDYISGPSPPTHPSSLSTTWLQHQNQNNTLASPYTQQNAQAQQSPAPTTAPAEGQMALQGQPQQPYPSPGSSAMNTLNQQAKMITQQRLETMSGLALGPEKLGLDFLLDPNHPSPTSSPAHMPPRSQVPRLQTGVNGAQDSGEYQHVPMKHDWKSSPFQQVGGSGSGRPPSVGAYSTPSPLSGMGGPATPPTQGFGPGGSDMSPYGPSSAGSNHGGSILAAYPFHSNHSTSPDCRGLLGDDGYFLPTKTCQTCPLDALLIDFLAERRQRAAEGLSPSEVIGPRYPSVSSLLNPAQSVFSHPLSKVFTDILACFPDISALPERVAVLYVMFLVMRFQISRNRENFERLPLWVRPLPIQIEKSHPAWIDYLPFPEMRQRLAESYNPKDYLFDNFFVPYTTTLSLNWPYDDTLTLLQSPDGNELMINPVFEQHLRNLDNWTLGHKFEATFPGLAGTFGVRETWRKRKPRE